MTFQLKANFLNIRDSPSIPVHVKVLNYDESKRPPVSELFTKSLKNCAPDFQLPQILNLERIIESKDALNLTENQLLSDIFQCSGSYLDRFEVDNPVASLSPCGPQQCLVIELDTSHTRQGQFSVRLHL